MLVSFETMDFILPKVSWPMLGCWPQSQHLQWQRDRNVQSESLNIESILKDSKDMIEIKTLVVPPIEGANDLMAECTAMFIPSI